MIHFAVFEIPKHHGSRKCVSYTVNAANEAGLRLPGTFVGYFAETTSAQAVADALTALSALYLAVGTGSPVKINSPALEKVFTSLSQVTTTHDEPTWPTPGTVEHAEFGPTRYTPESEARLAKEIEIKREREGAIKESFADYMGRALGRNLQANQWGHLIRQPGRRDGAPISHGMEESPFVQKIDELIPRKESK
jgi:hypothetical protein